MVEPYLLDRMDEVLDAVEGFTGLAFSRQAGASATIASLGDHMIGGHWGDVWFDSAGPPGLTANGDLAAIGLQKMSRPGREWPLEHLCAPHLEESPDSVLRQLVAEELARVDGIDDPEMRLKAFKTDQWSFRWTLASMRAYQLAVPTLVPFYANDIVDFFLRVPAARLPGRRLQIAHLLRHHPDLARITWEQTGMPLDPYWWNYGLALTRRAAAKASRTLRRAPAIERNWEVQYMGGDLPGQLRRQIRKVSSTSARLEHRQTDRFVEDMIAAPSAAHGYAADCAITLHFAISYASGATV